MAGVGEAVSGTGNMTTEHDSRLQAAAMNDEWQPGWTNWWQGFWNGEDAAEGAQPAATPWAPTANKPVDD